ncbi:CHAT domain-containing protein [Spirulina major CS-329]|uniref:CHAT domain-containing protein n=1 Tax=Spirulina TaxID=1154 RepID=UPI00232DACB0|nr:MULTISPECIES: CHAT domain-containing protein [Spirulina]MDB9494452.1 CHAT domain-containing protein [Spirulina subsalsa CS-330]MDB9501579.1 CHAT domain-containing protein [Spirulina major CS-329]
MQNLPSCAAILGASTLLIANVALAQSITPAPDGTNTHITHNGNTYSIQGGTQAGANLFHSFEQFGLSAGEVGQFLSNPSIANILGRVVGGNPSVINGLLQVTAASTNLYLINPAGILFGPGARLDVGGDFTATTADRIGINGAWFNATGPNDYHQLTGEPTLFSFLTDQPGLILNAGTLAVEPGQSLSLIGGEVLNTGTLTAPGGNILITAVPGSQRVRLSQPGHLLSVEVEADQLHNAIAPLQVKDLPALLTGGLEVGVSVDGAGRVKFPQSELEFPSEPGTTLLSGSVDASANTGMGGNVGIFGDRIALTQAQVNASGATGGGQILIGGNQEGQGPEPNAQFLFIDETSAVRADAITQGDGGNVILFAADTAHFLGNLSAKGGQTGGDGGFIETSGLKSFNIQTTPDISAPNGQGGTWLIDPYNIEIVAGLINTNINATNPFTSIGNSAQLGESFIRSGLALGNVTITTGSGGTEAGNITLSTTLDYNNLGTNRTLTLNATNSIFINQFIRDLDPTTPDALNLVLNADSDNSGAGVVEINGLVDLEVGNLTITGRSNTSTPAVNINETIFASDLTVTGTSTGSGEGILLNGFLNLGGGTFNGSSLGGTGIRNTQPVSNTTFLFDATFLINDPAIALSSAPLTMVSNNSIDLPNIAIESLKGGAVELRAENNIVIGAIAASNTTGNNVIGTPNPGGTGGTITLTAGELVRVVNTFSKEGVNVSLGSFGANGTTGGGNITITHGGNGTTPFIVGDASTNGTAGVITTGDFTISPTQSFDGSFTQGNIQIVTNRVEVAVCPPHCDQSQPSLDEETPTDAIATESIVQNALQNIANATGVKPAIIYAQFVPAQIPLPPTVERLESQFNREYKTAFDPLQPAPSDPYLSVEGTVSDRVQLVMITASGDPILHTVPIPRDRIEQIISQFRRSVTNTRSQSYITPSQQLYNWLIAPLIPDLIERDINNISWIGDEGLRGIPLAALYDGEKFLIETYSVGQMPSFSLTNFDYRPITRNSSVLAMGASQFSARNLAPLPAVPVELDLINNERNSDIFLNADFTWQNLKTRNQTRDFQILHLATHALFDPDFANESYIQLWGNESIQLDDLRELALYQEPELELLILSACTTAVGNADAELGFAGAAIQAGVKSVLASLWKVSDQGTMALMGDFYNQLNQPDVTIKAEALRRAQLSLLQGTLQPIPDGPNFSNIDLSHPFYWSAFSLVGSPW